MGTSAATNSASHSKGALWGAAFTSLVGNGTIGGSMLSAVFGWGQELGSRRVKACISVVMVLGGIVAAVFGRVPLELITTAQATTVLGVPLIGALLLLLAMDGKRLGSLKLDPVRLVVCGFGLAFLIVLATSYAGALLGQ